MKLRRTAAFTVALFSFSAVPRTAVSATGTWKLNASGPWASASNWDGTVPALAGDVAIFGPVITATRSIQLTAPVTVGSVIFDSPRNYRIVGTPTLTFASPDGTSSVSVASSSGNAAHSFEVPVSLASDLQLTNNATGTLTITGRISGPGALTKSGAGLLVLGNDNSGWEGTLEVAGGRLRLGYLPAGGSTGAYKGLGTGPVTVRAGATLDLDQSARGSHQNSIVNAIMVSGDGAQGVGALRISRGDGSVITGALTIADGAMLYSDAPAFGNRFGLAIGDPVSGAGALSGTGGLRLLGSPAFQAPAPFQLNVRSTHMGGTRLERVRLDVSPLGSLAGTGQVLVLPRGELRVYATPGPSGSAASVSPNSVALAGGTLALATDMQVAPFFSPTSTGGVLAIPDQFTNGGTNLLDISSLPGGHSLVIASTATATIPPELILKPDSTTRTLRFGSMNSPITLNASLSDFEARATHLEHRGPDALKLAAASTYTGATRVLGGQVQVLHAQALGSGSGMDADGTEVLGGAQLSVASNLTLEGEKLRLSGGEIYGGENTVIRSPVSVEGPPGVPGGIYGGAYEGPISGSGALRLGGLLTLSGANTLTGPIEVRNGRVDVRHPQALGASAAGTTVSGGELRLHAATAEPVLVTGTGKLHLAEGPVHGLPITLTGGTLTSDPGAAFGGTLEVRAGTLRPDLTGTGTVNVTGFVVAEGLGAGFEGPVHVRRGGVVRFRDGALGSPAAGTHVHGGATLLVTGGTSAEPVFLRSDAAGVATLRAETGASSTFTGPLDLGQGEAAVTLAGGSTSTSLTLAGPVQGGALTVSTSGNSFGGTVTLTSPDNSYTGKTVLKDFLTVRLGGEGSLRSSTGVEVGLQSVLSLQSSNTDRIGDLAPVTLKGGALELTTGSEIAGQVSLANGFSRLTSAPGGLTLGGIGRANGAAVGLGAVNFSTPPSLNDGMIGGWAVMNPGVYSYSPGTFAGYGPQGVIPVLDSVKSINAASASDNVGLDVGETLKTSKTINSLRVFRQAVLNLGGRTLTVDSGGVIGYGRDLHTQSPPQISGGRLLPGPGREMFFYNDLVVAATVADAPGGPTSVTATGVIYFTSPNEYTGHTSVNGNLIVEAPGGLPDGGDLHLTQGGVTIAYTSDRAVRLGTVYFHDEYAASYIGGGAKLNARAYEVKSGGLGPGLEGNGTITKTSPGVLRLSGDGSAFSGAIKILEGRIEVQGNTLGTGPVEIATGGHLMAYPAVSNPVHLRGGTLGTDGRPSTMTGPLRVTGNAAIRHFTVSGPTTVEQDATLDAGFDTSVRFLGDLHVDGVLTSSGSQLLAIAPAAERKVTGRGVIVGNVSLASGSVEPGSLKAASGRTGILKLDGALTMGAAGAMKLELGPAAQNDRLEVSGRAALGGTLHLSMLDGFTPAPQERVTVLAYGSRLGVFTRYEGLDFPGPLTFAPIFSPTTLTLVATVPGDADLSGGLDGDDYLLTDRGFLGRLEGWENGDFNSDGVVNIADYFVIDQAFSTAGGAGEVRAAGARSVPEPSCLVAALLSLAATRRRRKRRR